MPVIRVVKDKNYTVMSNFHLRDMRLSNKAIGLMSKMLSLPDGWDYTVNGLSTICKDGRDGIAAQLKELEANGYLKREQVRAQGKFGEIEYILTEKPFTEKPYTEKPQDDNENAGDNGVYDAEKPYTEKPITENPIQLSTNKSSMKKTVLSNKETEKMVEHRSEIFKEAWQGFVDMRKAKKKPLTKRAVNNIFKELEKLANGDDETQAAILDQSTNNCWTSVYPLKESKSKQCKQKQDASELLKKTLAKIKGESERVG